MKSILTFILSLGFISSFAQWNITAGSIDWEPDSSAGMPAANFYHSVQIEARSNFNIIGGGSLSNDYPLCDLPMTYQISLSGGASFIGAAAADAVVTTGPNNWKARFDWVYTDGTQTVIIGTQNTTIPTGSMGSANTFHFQVLTPSYSSNFVITVAMSEGAGGTQCTQDVNTVEGGDDEESTDGFTNATLPLQKFELNARIVNHTTSQITWSTLNEKNSHEFEIERKIGRNLNWSKIATVPAAGFSTTEKKYDYIDNFNETNERIYYRIKQIDLDGAFTYTDIKSIQINPGPLQINGFPNPIINQYSLQIHSKNEERISLEVVDILGRIISKETLNINSGTYYKKLQFGSLPAGPYIIKVNGQRNSGLLTVVKVDG